MAIRVQRHANVSKQATFLGGVDFGPPKWRVLGRGLIRYVHEGMNDISKCKGSFKESQWKCKYCVKSRAKRMKCYNLVLNFGFIISLMWAAKLRMVLSQPFVKVGL